MRNKVIDRLQPQAKRLLLRTGRKIFYEAPDDYAEASFVVWTPN
jgi:hypothetical protein